MFPINVEFATIVAAPPRHHETLPHHAPFVRDMTGAPGPVVIDASAEKMNTPGPVRVKPVVAP